MRVILDVIEGPQKGRRYVFDSHDTFIVGRSRYVHCPVPEDEALSRDHFLIEIQPPLCELRDLGSTNGTYVNQRRIERTRLNPGDEIAAGQSVFLVKVDRLPAGGPGVGKTPAAAPAGQTVLLGLDGVPIRCAGCGTIAPPDVDVASDSSLEGEGPVEWLCHLCRADVESSPQPVPHYTTIRELGRGAMGVVYQARHNQTGAMVALKLITPENAAARTAIDRFLREMSVISQLKHPNIVEWFEQGISRGHFWFAMEFVQGMNLEVLAQKSPGSYPIREACRMATQVLKGLEHAHGLGFVHRDIKPENILIGKTPRGYQAKISDFGLAKNFRSLGFSGLTFSGEMRGTIPFMPPEQIYDFKTVSPSADLYSTAATLYYLITCQYVYDEEAESTDLLHRVLEGPVVPIHQRRPDVPAKLDAVIYKCLARDPKDRFPTAAEMRAALRPFC